MNLAMIMSSGVGLRFGANTPKQYLELDGREVIGYVIDAVKSAKKVDKFVVVCNEPYDKEMREKYGVDTTLGGNTRNKSCRNGVEYFKKNYSDCDKIIIIDAVRPFITGQIIDEYLSKIGEYDICVSSKKITDSLCSMDSAVCDRDRYYLTSSPMAFKYAVLDKYLDADSPVVEILQMCPADTKTYLRWYNDNIKITYREDIELCEALINLRKKERK